MYYTRYKREIERDGEAPGEAIAMLGNMVLQSIKHDPPRIGAVAAVSLMAAIYDAETPETSHLGPDYFDAVWSALIAKIQDMRIDVYAWAGPREFPPMMKIAEPDDFGFEEPEDDDAPANRDAMDGFDIDDDDDDLPFGEVHPDQIMVPPIYTTDGNAEKGGEEE